MSGGQSASLDSITVVLVGAGNMGGAMLRGWISGGMPTTNVQVLDPSPPDQMRAYLNDSGITYHSSPDSLKPPDVLLLAVKPQVMDKVAGSVSSLAGPNTVAVSVAAGKRLATISEPLGAAACIRAMPNTPALVQRGITVCCASEKVTENQRQQVDLLLRAIGKVEWVEDETLIDAVTAVSGSGPAYVFHLAECMAEAGKAAGLPTELAMTLARETIAGAGELMRLSEDTPTTLRQNVTSPNGTTAAALEVFMDKDGMQQLVERAILAAKKRSEELS